MNSRRCNLRDTSPISIDPRRVARSSLTAWCTNGFGQTWIIPFMMNCRLFLRHCLMFFCGKIIAEKHITFHRMRSESQYHYQKKVPLYETIQSIGVPTKTNKTSNYPLFPQPPRVIAKRSEFTFIRSFSETGLSFYEISPTGVCIRISFKRLVTSCPSSAT